MNTRYSTGIASLVTFASMLTASADARGTEEFPGTIRYHLRLDYDPPCSICHENGMVGVGTVRTPFGMSLRLRGLAAEQDDSLTVALDALDKEQVDSDRDGVTDIAELKTHTDPNRYGALPLDQANEPVYGCGGTVARSRNGADAPAATMVMGLVAAALWARRRKRE